MIIGAQLPSVDAGGGWLIFALPPAEVAAHPADDDSGAHRLLHTQFYLMNRSSSRAAVRSACISQHNVAQTLVSAAPRLISAFVHWSVQDVGEIGNLCAGSQPGKLNSNKEEAPRRVSALRTQVSAPHQL